MANCPNCGGIMRYDIPKQKLSCTSCDSDFDPYSIDQVNKAEDNGDGNEFRVFACPSCGGELYSTDYDLSGNCSFCGSPVVFETRMCNEKRPDYIIPFQKTKEDCKKAYLDTIKKCKFLPDGLSDPEHIEGFRGIYVPYWIYDVNQEGKPFDIEASHSYTKGDYDYKDTYKLSGSLKCAYHEIYHDASSVLADDISEQVEPFTLRKYGQAELADDPLKPFTPSYFSGFYAEPADVAQETYHSYAKEVAENRSKKYVDEKSGIKEFKISKYLKEEHYNTQIKETKLGVFPVWFLSYRKNDRVAYAAINGQTGRLISDLPIAISKFMKSVVITAAILFAILNFMTILPKSVTMLSVFTALLVTCYCKDDANILLQRRQDSSNDKKRSQVFTAGSTFTIFVIGMIVAGIAKGWIFFDNDMEFLTSNFVYLVLCLIFLVWQFFMTASMLRNIPVFQKEKYYGYFFPILCLGATIYGTFIIYSKPVNDSYYYVAALIVIAICLFSFVGLILNYNKVATRPLPQFKVHTGGDDRA